MKRPAGEALRVSVEWVSPEETEEEKEAWERYMKGDRSEEVLGVVHRRKSGKIETIMKAGEEDLFNVTWQKAELPPEASIYRSVRCELCGEKVMEPRARLREGKTVCIPCFEKAG
jgi:formylmethanofuran dehydrogenase subunit E